MVGRALAHGRRTALATACGHAAGNYVVAACVAVGLGALLQRSAAVFVVVKLAGALYPVWLGIHAIRHRKSLADAFAVAVEPREGWRSLRDRGGGHHQPQVIHLVRRGLGLRVGVRGEGGARLVRLLAAAVTGRPAR